MIRPGTNHIDRRRTLRPRDYRWSRHDFGQNPQAALDAPRWQIRDDKKLWVEPGFEPAVYEELTRRGHDVVVRPQRHWEFGAGEVIYKMDEGYCAASEPRADGQAVGF